MTLLLFSCNDGSSSAASKRSSSTLFAEYYIRYLEEEGQLRAQVSYLEGDSLANAKPATLNSIFFQGGAMELRKLGAKGIRYRSERAMEYTPPFSFTYNMDGRAPGNHDMNMSPVRNISAEGPLTHSGQTTLKWEGAPLAAQETLVLILTDQKNQTAAINLAGPSTENQIIVRGEDIKKLTPGEVKFYLVKKKKEDVQKQDIATTSTIEFYTKTSVAELKD